jgi:hypothetical protein
MAACCETSREIKDFDPESPATWDNDTSFVTITLK